MIAVAPRTAAISADWNAPSASIDGISAAARPVDAATAPRAAPFIGHTRLPTN